MTFSAVKYETKKEMGENPASVDMLTGELILNRDVFLKKSKFTQKFIKEHEKGHLLLDTDNEQVADEYALTRLYKTANKSLKKSINALAEFLPDDDPRIENLYYKALELDKSNRKNFTMGNINIRTLMKSGRGREVNFRRNADGDPENPETTPAETTRPKRFVEVAGYAFTIFEVIVGVLFVILAIKKMK